jgi:uncharacterized membrane protein YphA (DoxX/SURF4 family)
VKDPRAWGMTVGRVAAGVFLSFGGFMKLRAPATEFAAALEAYRVFPDVFLRPISLVLPWMEFLIGLYLAVGLWTRWSARAACVLYAGFVSMLGIALLRGISLDSCGCFGGAWVISPVWTLAADSVFLLVSAAVALSPASLPGVDRWTEAR